MHRHDDPITLVDLRSQLDRLRTGIDDAIEQVLSHARFIHGPEVEAFEVALASYCGVSHAITCGNGTDALALCLRAAHIGPGDAVLVPSFTFVATAEAVVLVGATPIFLDVNNKTFTIDDAQLLGAYDLAVSRNLRPSAVIAVDLFGNPADYRALSAFCDTHSMTLIADAAQSITAQREGRRVGALAHMTATSFFPTKPLGCYGDGGAVLTSIDSLAEELRSLRNHGSGIEKYNHLRIGTNSRLDTIQAAILLQKLRIADAERDRRASLASRYINELQNRVGTQHVRACDDSAWAQFTITVSRRDDAVAHLSKNGVPTAVHYPMPLHRQPAYYQYPAVDDTSTSLNLSAKILSLPLHAYLSEAAQDHIIGAVLSFLENPRAGASLD